MDNLGDLRCSCANATTVYDLCNACLLEYFEWFKDNQEKLIDVLL